MLAKHVGVREELRHFRPETVAIQGKSLPNSRSWAFNMAAPFTDARPAYECTKHRLSSLRVKDLSATFMLANFQRRGRAISGRKLSIRLMLDGGCVKVGRCSPPNNAKLNSRKSTAFRSPKFTRDHPRHHDPSASGRSARPGG